MFETQATNYLQTPSIAPVVGRHEHTRHPPNIVICGTPGTGKSELAREVAQQTGVRHIEIGAYAKEKDLVEEYDEEYDSYVIDEDKVVDLLEEEVNNQGDPFVEGGGAILVYHGCDFLPEEWVDAVIVLRTDNTLLYDRLATRGYNESKIQQNVECEIMQVIQDEAKDAFPDACFRVYRSNTTDDFERNVGRVVAYVTGSSAQLEPSDRGL